MIDEWSLLPLGPLFLITNPPPSWLGHLGIGYKGKVEADLGHWFKSLCLQSLKREEHFSAWAAGAVHAVINGGSSKPLPVEVSLLAISQDSVDWTRQPKLDTVHPTNHSPSLECSGLRDSGGSCKGKSLFLFCRLGWTRVEGCYNWAADCALEGEEWPDMAGMVCGPG